MCKISVIIPTHNRADLLSRAINSVQLQTMPVDEIIVVSDGSTDNTNDIVMEMKGRDERIQLISYYPGHNGNYARNQGLKVATGEYIAFLDDDDEWLPDKIEKQMQLFNSHPEYGLVYSAQNCIYKDEGLSYVTKPIGEGDLSRRIFIYNDIGTPSQVMVKTSVIKEVGVFDLELGALQDYDLWIRCCQKTKIGFVEDACINYYNDSTTNQVSANTEKYIHARRYIAKKYAHIVKTFDDKTQREIQAIVEMRIAQRCLRNGNKKDARKYAIESLKIKVSKKAIILYIASFFSYNTVVKVRSRFNYWNLR